MRVLIAVALLMMCTALAQRIEPAPKQEKAQPAPDYEQRWIDGKCFSVPKDLWLGGANPILPCSGEAKQEKAQPAAPSTFIVHCKDCVLTQPLPFDLPAKEWDIQQWDGSSAIVIPHYSCKDVAPDWKQCVLLDSADGKHHCYAFYLLEQKP